MSGNAVHKVVVDKMFARNMGAVVVGAAIGVFLAWWQSR
jgi:hypothetical protein